MTLKKRIFFSIFSLGMFFVFVSLGVFYFFSSGIVKKQASQYLINAGDIRSDFVSSIISSSKNKVHILNEVSLVDDLIDLKKVLKSIIIADESFYAAEYIDEYGNTVYSYGLTDSHDITVSVKAKLNFFNSTGGGVIASDPALIDGVETVIYSEAVYDEDGARLGSIHFYQSLGPDQSNDSIYSILLGKNEASETEDYYLVNSDGYMISPSRFVDNTFLGTRVNTENFHACDSTQDNKKLIISNDYRDISVWGVRNKIPNTSWCLLSEIDESEALKPLRDLSILVVAMFIFSILLMLFIAEQISKQIVNPINELIKGAQSVQAGNYDFTIETKSNDELGSLTQAFNAMAFNVKQSRLDITKKVDDQTKEIKVQNTELENKQIAMVNILTDVSEEKEEKEELITELEKFKLAVDHTSEMIVITDNEGLILYANAATERITGFKSEEYLGKKAGSPTLWGGLMGTEFYKKMWQTIKVEQKSFNGAVQNKRKNGDLYYVDSHISPILDSSKNVEFFVAIERDITKEKNVDRMKTEFISLASHQLRTPLSAIKWFLEIIMSGDVGEINKELLEVLEKIFSSNERMIELVNSLLNISRLESGRIIIDPKPTKIKELLDDVLFDVKGKSVHKKHDLVVNIAPDLPEISIDPKLIREVYLNIITNSIKYTHNNGKININITKNDTEIISEISDNGMGIPVESQKNLFKKFFRADNVAKSDTEGTGLGLYLVKAIVEASGGKIWFKSPTIESVDIGDITKSSGTTFWFSLPLSGSPKQEGDVEINN